jgi:hypothetical protein
MKLIDDVSDLGSAEHCVTGVSAIERISHGQIRVSYYSRRRGDNFEVVHVVWDLQAFRAYCALLSCSGEVIAEPVKSDGSSWP